MARPLLKRLVDFGGQVSRSANAIRWAFTRTGTVRAAPVSYDIGMAYRARGYDLNTRPWYGWLIIVGSAYEHFMFESEVND